MLLSVDQSKRMNASEALKHPWIVVRKNTALKFVFDNILMNGTVLSEERNDLQRARRYNQIALLFRCRKQINGTHFILFLSKLRPLVWVRNW